MNAGLDFAADGVEGFNGKIEEYALTSFPLT
jgi:hypothetical protein